jgi:hypothetical protein
MKDEIKFWFFVVVGIVLLCVCSGCVDGVPHDERLVLAIVFAGFIGIAAHQLITGISEEVKRRRDLRAWRERRRAEGGGHA